MVEDEPYWFSPVASRFRTGWLQEHGRGSYDVVMAAFSLITLELE